MNWYLKCLRQYADVSGRARRSEYWFFVLFNFFAGIVLGVLALVLKTPVLTWIYQVAIFIPSLAVCVRRLHDIGKSGWFLLISLIPIIGAIWLLVLYCQDSQPGTNQWGANPKEEEVPFKEA